MSTENIEPTTPAEAERRAAIAALTHGAEVSTAEPVAPVVRTGNEVYCGGDEPRLLVKRASTLGWGDGKGGYQRCEAVPGDVVTLTKAQATRLDGLGVTVDPDTDLEALAEGEEDGVWTDEQIRAAKAADLVGYVASNPEERARVRTLEEARSGSRASDGPRKSVLSATESTPEEDEAAEEEAAARKAAEQDQGSGE